MAEQIPFNIIADVLTKLGSSAIQQIGSAFGVAKELTKLTEKLDAIRGVLLDAEEKQEKSHAVKTWVRRLKDVVYDADDLLDDFATHQLQRGGVARQLYLCKVKEVVLRELMLATASSLESVSVESIDDLMSLPDELRQHVSTLQTLKIWDCSRLATIPRWIGNLTSLTELGIGYCPELTSLPQEMRSLTNLHSLSIDYSCGLASSPNWIGGLTSLTDLEICSCSQLTSLPKELRSLGILKSLTIHDWSGLTTLPDWIGSLTSLTDLEIGPCPELTSLPEELCSFRILKSLTIHDWPGLTTLPDWIGNLSSLEELRLCKCPKLTSLPEEMRSLTNLHRVEIIHCPYLSERYVQERPKIAHASSIAFRS